jgi:ATP-dependent DNA ligase
VKLPLTMPFYPMEAKIAAKIPAGAAWEYEPKWDGFRCLAFRDGKDVELQSKAGQPLTRYFPEVVAALGHATAKKFVLDGELIVPVDGRLSFDDLLQRIHPAASRVELLSHQHPAQMVVFDFLVDAKGKALVEEPLEERRKKLLTFHAKYFSGSPTISLSLATRDVAVAKRWMTEMRGQLDGIVAKRVDQAYVSGERAMVKVKTLRSADCVVGGFRYGSGKAVVGSLLLGLYDEKGLLNHVGFTSALADSEVTALTKKLEKLIAPPGFTGNAPGGPSRWSTERSAEFEPLKPSLVVEVSYDHFTGKRFRHGTKLLRWRPDKDPKACTIEQVAFENTVPFVKLFTAS